MAGVPASDLEAHLREAIGRVFHNYELNASLGKSALSRFMYRNSGEPGVYTVSSLSTLVDALFHSGGPSAKVRCGASRFAGEQRS